MSARRVFSILAATVGLLWGLTTPASAGDDAIESKRVDGPGDREGTVTRYEELDGRARHNMTLKATDPDGRDGRCTEVWVDYRTRPHHHLNPGLFVNCAGGTHKASRVMATAYHGVVGVGVVICQVPDTSGPITRDKDNCRGRLNEMDLHSGERYERYRVDADDYPSGVRIWRA